MRGCCVKRLFAVIVGYLHQFGWAAGNGRWEKTSNFLLKFVIVDAVVAWAWARPARPVNLAKYA